MSGYQFLDVANELVVAGTPNDAGRYDELVLMDAVGTVVAMTKLAIDAQVIDRNYRTGLVAVGEYLISRRLERRSMKSGKIVRLATGLVLIDVRGPIGARSRSSRSQAEHPSCSASTNHCWSWRAALHARDSWGEARPPQTDLWGYD